MAIYQGAGPPEAYTLNITPATGADIDLLLVTDAVIVVQHPDETTIVEWPCTRSNQTPSTLRLTHAFAAGGTDLPRPGPYTTYARLLTEADAQHAAGVLRTAPRTLVVRGRFDPSP